MFKLDPFDADRSRKCSNCPKSAVTRRWKLSKTNWMRLSKLQSPVWYPSRGREQSPWTTRNQGKGILELDTRFSSNRACSTWVSFSLHPFNLSRNSRILFRWTRKSLWAPWHLSWTISLFTSSFLNWTRPSRIYVRSALLRRTHLLKILTGRRCLLGLFSRYVPLCQSHLRQRLTVTGYGQIHVYHQGVQ